MKPLFLKIESTNVYTIREQLVSHVYSKYYYHPQIEIVYFEKSDGMCIIGDKVHIIKEGDIFMLGENLPHLFRNDEKYADKKLKVRIIALHFLPDFGGKEFLELPDLRNIKLLLKKAERGITVEGKTRTEVGKILKQMLTVKGPGKMVLLLQALTLISTSRDTKMILPIGFQPQINEQNEDRINDVYSYTMQIAHLSEHSFCRYFKAKTGKTYTNFLHEIRIKHACKLLIESKLSISQIINECGFVNYANFFRYFKMLTGKTPAEYQKLNNDLITEK
jgi:AraC-like DNA-binding protein